MPTKAARKQINENWVTGISIQIGTETRKTMGSSDRFELAKEYKPGFKASFGPMQKKSCFSVKIVDKGNFSLKTGSVQVLPIKTYMALYNFSLIVTLYCRAVVCELALSVCCAHVHRSPERAVLTLSQSIRSQQPGVLSFCAEEFTVSFHRLASSLAVVEAPSAPHSTRFMTMLESSPSTKTTPRSWKSTSSGRQQSSSRH
jgi:hypothetical protein